MNSMLLGIFEMLEKLTIPFYVVFAIVVNVFVIILVNKWLWGVYNDSVDKR